MPVCVHVCLLLCGRLGGFILFGNACVPGKPNPEFSDFKGRPLPTNPPTYAPQERNPECGKTTCPDNHPWLNIREFQYQPPIALWALAYSS